MKSIRKPYVEKCPCIVGEHWRVIDNDDVFYHDEDDKILSTWQQAYDYACRMAKAWQEVPC